MDAPDQFLNLTAAGWTAIGSFVSTASVMVLVIFNWKYVRLADAQCKATTRQADLAEASLKALQAKILEDQKLEHHAALTILRATSFQVVSWRAQAKSEVRPPTDLDGRTQEARNRFKRT